jgi:hypothetical protein
MNCPDCGSPVEKEAQFCPKCYARIEPPTFWQKLFRLFQSSRAPRQPIISIKRTVSVRTTDKDGQRHEYHSLDELPSELRAEVEKAQAEALKQGLGSSSSGPGTITINTTKKVSLFKVKDAEGNEQVYHSLEELPPDLRAAYEEAERRRAESSGHSP